MLIIDLLRDRPAVCLSRREYRPNEYSSVNDESVSLYNTIK